MTIALSLANERRGLSLKGAELGFGRHFSDHMFVCNYTRQKGWHEPRIEPYGPFSLDPAAMVLHYGQAIFEGLKAYSGGGDSILLFRADRNMERMRRSASRLSMPDFDPEMMLGGMKKLLQVDSDWVPREEGCSLYIRPTMIATEPGLGVRPSNSYLFFIILSPSGSYFPTGWDPISLMVETKYSRACLGGTGDVKTAGNYGGSLIAKAQAEKQGYTQVIWLDAAERRYVEECGMMNLFFLISDELVTSPLTGSILPGITRESVIELVKDWASPRIVERQISIDEVCQAAREGTLKEAFGTGTAAVVVPIESFSWQGKKYQLGRDRRDSLAKKLHDSLVGIQTGTIEDRHGWVEEISL